MTKPAATDGISVNEFCRRTGMVPTQVYVALALGRIKGRKVCDKGIRRVWRIPESEAERVRGARA